MRKVAWLALGAALALAGCEHFTIPIPGGPVAPPAAQPAPPTVPAPAPEVETKIVRIPNRCVPEDVGGPPAYPDSDAALRDAGGAADRYQLLAAGRLMREARLRKLEEVVRRCRAAAR